MGKIRACVTDSTKEVFYDPVNRPGVSNLIVIHAELIGEDPETVGKLFMSEGLNKVQLKELVTRTLIEKLSPIRTEMERLLKDPQYLDESLNHGQRAAKDIANETMTDVRKLVGLSC